MRITVQYVFRTRKKNVGYWFLKVSTSNNSSLVIAIILYYITKALSFCQIINNILTILQCICIFTYVYNQKTFVTSVGLWEEAGAPGENPTPALEEPANSTEERYRNWQFNSQPLNLAVNVTLITTAGLCCPSKQS